jgi:hypothetical protein
VTGDERNKLAKAWIALQTTQHAPEYNSLFWSFERTYDLVREDPVEAWKLILTIWSLDQSLPTRQSLSAGPIEELLCFHGEYIIPHIERQAKADPSFAALLGGVWQNTMSDSIWNRLQEAWIALDGFPFLKTRRLQQSQEQNQAQHQAQNQAQREKLPPLEVLQSTLLEFAKLGALLLCMFSIYVVFRTLFLSIEDSHAILQPPQIFTNRILDALLLIALSAAISLLGGIIFRESEPKPHSSLAATLPLQIFSWATSIMLTLFVLAHFLETHYIFSPKVHW